MNEPALQGRIEQIVAPFLAERGVELVELALSGGPRRWVLRIYADRPGGITIGECAELSRGVADLLDIHDPIQGSYVLEVSSPGLNRPLKTERDYHRAVGQAVKLLVEGRGTVVGTLISYGGTELALKVGGDVLTLPAADVKKANLHFDF